MIKSKHFMLFLLSVMNNVVFSVEKNQGAKKAPSSAKKKALNETKNNKVKYIQDDKVSETVDLEKLPIVFDVDGSKYAFIESILSQLTDEEKYALLQTFLEGNELLQHILPILKKSESLDAAVKILQKYGVCGLRITVSPLQEEDLQNLGQ